MSRTDETRSCTSCKNRTMYHKLTVKDSTFTIPKENIGLLAFTKAQDMGKIINPNDKEGAIRFLEGIGIEVEDYDE